MSLTRRIEVRTAAVAVALLVSTGCATIKTAAIKSVADTLSTGSGDVFTRDVISTWIWYKREKEVDAIRLRPHPYEFMLYYDI